MPPRNNKFNAVLPQFQNTAGLAKWHRQRKHEISSPHLWSKTQNHIINFRMLEMEKLDKIIVVKKLQY